MFYSKELKALETSFNRSLLWQFLSNSASFRQKFSCLDEREEKQIEEDEKEAQQQERLSSASTLDNGKETSDPEEPRGN